MKELLSMATNASNVSQKKQKYRPLGEKEHRFLSEFIYLLLKVANDEKHSMRAIARGQISLTMWRWTADGVCLKTGTVKQNALKYDVTQLPCTKQAKEKAKTSKKDLRHEHTVPRILLTDYIIENELSADDIYKFLRRYCKTVIVTRDEDKQLSTKNMPTDWNFPTIKDLDSGACEYARYKVAKIEKNGKKSLYEEIEHPKCE